MMILVLFWFTPGGVWRWLLLAMCMQWGLEFRPPECKGCAHTTEDLLY